MDAKLTIAEPSTASVNSTVALHNQETIAGSVVLIRRDETCDQAKVRAAQDAEAIGVIIIHNDETRPDAIGDVPTGDLGQTVDIPVLLVSHNVGRLMLARTFEFGAQAKITFAGNPPPPPPPIQPTSPRG